MMAQASRACGEGSVTARLLQSAPAVISQGSGRARAETGMQRPWSRWQRKLSNSMNGGGSNTENSGDGGSDGWWELQGTAGRGRI